MISASAGTAATARRSSGDAPVTTTTVGDGPGGCMEPRFLRRHYPVQVLGSAAATALSAHRSRELPVLVVIHGSGGDGWRGTPLAHEGEGGEADEHEHHARDLGRLDRLPEDQDAPADGQRRLADLD